MMQATDQRPFCSCSRHHHTFSARRSATRVNSSGSVIGSYLTSFAIFEPLARLNSIRRSTLTSSILILLISLLLQPTRPTTKSYSPRPQCTRFGLPVQPYLQSTGRVSPSVLIFQNLEVQVPVTIRTVHAPHMASFPLAGKQKVGQPKGLGA